MSIVAPRLTTRLPRPGRRGGPGGLAGLHKPSRLAYALLLAFIAGSAFPVYWTFVAASGTNEVIASTPPALLPGGHLFGNISRVFATTDFGLALRNSVIVSGTVTASVLLFSTLAGFAFAKMRFRGRDAALLLVIGRMMVPTQLGIIPLYILMNTLGLAGRLPAVILPFMVTGFGVFFMRQFISEAVPDELLEAARVDGASTLGTFWHVVVPAVRPALAVLGLFTFMTTGTSSSGRWSCSTPTARPSRSPCRHCRPGTTPTTRSCWPAPPWRRCRCLSSSSCSAGRSSPGSWKAR